MQQWWDLRDAAGREIAPDAPERRGWLLERGAAGRLHACRGTAPGRSGDAGRVRPGAAGPPLHAGAGRPDLRCGRPRRAGSGPGRKRRNSPGWPPACGRGAAGSRKRSCAPTRISARCADSMERSAATGSGSRRRTSAGTARRGRTRYRTRYGHWLSARCTTRCSTWVSSASPRTGGSAYPDCMSPGTRRTGQSMRSPVSQLVIPRPRQPVVDVMYISWHHQQVFKGAIQPSNAASERGEKPTTRR